MAPDSALRRRTLLAGAAGTLAATSGCVGELRNLMGRERSSQLSLSIATMPASDDPYAVRIANELADNLQQAGIDTTVDLMSQDVLLRNVLINQDFDIYVARYPSEATPDELRSLLHSSYGEEAGWQNPFGFSDLGVDELLDGQRQTDGQERRNVIHDIQRELVRQQPFTVVSFPDRIAGTRDDRFQGWPAGGPSELPDYLALETVAESDTIRLLLTDPRITRNRNPIAAEHRDRGDIVGLVYDSLIREVDDESVPWLARDIEWDGDGAATVRLRETPWHDGTQVTASDIDFTYRFLKDTSLGEFDTSQPTPWLRGATSLVDEVEVIADDECRIEFTTSVRDIARRALELPILPEHIWAERSNPADVAGLDIVGRTTEALVVSNEEAIGSGPLQFVEASQDQSLLLERFDDHFLEAGDASGIPSPLNGGLPFQQARFDIVPSHDTAVEVLETAGADASIDGLQASVVPRIGRSDDISLTVRQSAAFYHVGYNCRNAPLSNPRFRQAVARLIDRDYLVSDAFNGYAGATELPLSADWTPSDLRWDGEGSLPFAGENGILDVSAARDGFRDAGYQYDDDRLVHRGGS
ncbi:MAG: peptide/nickel transport system substrate-binding protein [Natronomonas sp.]|jgi:peptide/nickel transport system substrate-binding protein|uniref:ABC transporter substrate-binding protein n=1 Tax=Natronomonas sp. TaxID=2184060 RepID=UPI0039891280